MSGIFISYRKDDTGAWAINLRDHLVRQFGERQVFFDVDSIGPGQWRAQIDHALDRCRVALVLIGPRWAATSDAAGTRRLTLTDDVHRAEIATALRRANVTVIPLLLDGARLPQAYELPDDVLGLLECQAREIGQSHDRRSAELRQLDRTLDALTGRRRLRTRAVSALAVTVAVALLNTFLATDSVVAGIVFLGVAAGLAVLAGATYRQMAREMRGAWVALLALILSAAIGVGSLIRLLAK